MDRILAVDYGTAVTTALVLGAGGVVRPVLVDGREELPSAVFDGTLAGAEAVRQAWRDPSAYRPNPKLELGLDPAAVRDVAATLRRVGAAAPAERVVLTVAAGWPEPQRRALVRAAEQAGWARPELVARPVAVAAYAERLLGRAGAALVFHVGAGGFEAALVDGGAVAAAVAGPTGGLALDRLVAEAFRDALADRPQSRRDWALLLDNAREAREALSGRDVVEPLRAAADALTREALEAAIGPALTAAVAAARIIAPAGVPWVLSGRVSATPLLARLVGGEPLVLRHPRFAVGAGALLHAGAGPGALARLPLDERRTYATGGGHITSTWTATTSTVPHLRESYRHSLPDHVEHPGDRWQRRHAEHGRRHFHDVRLFPASDPAAAGLGPGHRIPDHLATIVREDTAVLPGDA